jgi:hypothetical protein
MKKTALKVILVIMFLLSTVVGTQLVQFGKANPTILSRSLGTIPPDSNTQPPVISVFSPENHTSHSAASITFSLNVSVGGSTTASSKYIGEILYRTDWQTSNTTIYEYNPTGDPYSAEKVITSFSKTLNLAGIPDGNHSLTVYAKERGAYYNYTDYGEGSVWTEYYYLFEIDGSSKVYFTTGIQPTPTSTPQVEPVSTPLIAAVVILVAIGTIALIVVVCAGLLIYYRKSRRGKTQ